MSDHQVQKTQVEFLQDVTSQLKEMRHYAQTNSETLSAQWLAFDAGEYKNKQFAQRIDTLLNQQGKLLDELESVIQDIEISVNHTEQES
ncbi:hypothetical protein [Tatumella sp. JGM118]|uniref:Uncharacterized protein n=1 Tax=Tatumella terrea TaxID=419007 RepID=A0ABW1VZH0_9GAMM|nr:hypothetical protein [Tatumella sp. JGM118]MBS0909951.1 hypothetical protein [Tatumella sp. JGM118]